MPNKEIDLFKEMLPAIDIGIKELYDAAGDDGKKDISGDLWNLNRYVSSVNGSYEKQAMQVLKVNEYYNKNWAVLGARHPKLQWQILCVSGRTGKKEFHPWIALKKKKDDSSKSVQLLNKIYPNMKQDEAELLAKISTKQELRKLAEDHGFEDFKL
jgi:hypothetical protein